MSDFLFLLVIAAFFLLAIGFVRVCEAIGGAAHEAAGGSPREVEGVSLENAVGLVLAVLVLAYLIFALVFPERLG